MNYQRLTEPEKARIQELAPTVSVKQIARMLGRSPSTIRSFVVRSKIPRAKRAHIVPADPERTERIARMNDLPPGRVITTIYRRPER